MQLLLFASQDGPNDRRLVVAVREALPFRHVQTMKTMNALHTMLCTVIEPESIAVLTASTYAELKQIVALRSLLTEIFVILIVPDKRKNTIRLAHLLLPRFISQTGDSYSELKQVLTKIICTPH